MADLTQDLGGEFNPDDHPDEYAIMPADEYLAIITDSELKDNKARTGKYLELKLQVISQNCKGRTLFERLNIVNPNEVAERIGKQTLASICSALGIRSIKDSMQLHNRPLVINVIIEDSNFRASGKDNAIKGYRAAKNPNAIEKRVEPQGETETVTIEKKDVEAVQPSKQVAAENDDIPLPF
jgi:Protein of unknown function (DUF669)